MNLAYIGFIKSAYTLLFSNEKQAHGFEKVEYVTGKNGVK